MFFTGVTPAWLGRSVVLVDSLPLIGGQMVHSLIGLFCGIFGNAPDYTQLTHGVFDDLFRELGPSGDLHFARGHTTTVFYNEVALGRWLERTVRDGDVRVRAAGFVDASGDAALTRQAGLPCWVPERPIYGSQQVIVENLDENDKPESGKIDAVLAARGDEFGLLRRGGVAGRSTQSSTCRRSRPRPRSTWTSTGCSRPSPTRSRCSPRSGPTARRRSRRSRTPAAAVRS